MKLAINPRVRGPLETYRHDLPGALLLSGEAGIGLATIAHELAGPDASQIQPQLLSKQATIPQIGIEQIRELYEMTRATSSKPRVVIIDDANAMTPSAQNAFLKLLEEPNDATRFILTTHHTERLLATLRSRTQELHIPRLAPGETDDLIADQPPRTHQQLRFIADGLPAELHRLMADQTYFASVSKEVTLARELLEATGYDRLCLIMTSSLDRAETLRLIDRLISLLMRSVEASSLRYIDALLVTRQRIRQGGALKLQLTAALL